MIIHREWKHRPQSRLETTHRPLQTIELPVIVKTPTIAFGSDTNCCVHSLHNDQARLIGSFGDLDDAHNYREFTQKTYDHCESFGKSPIRIVCDLHPAFMTTRFARKLASQTINGSNRPNCVAVQHHHAHVVSCAIDNGIVNPVVGIACDGNGYGADGHNWGCEVLVADANRFVRFGQLEYFCLPGGDAAALEPWRCALSLLWQAFEGQVPAHIHRVFGAVPSSRVDACNALLASKVACPLSSSLGRLFDAVSFLCGLCEPCCRDGHAARILESVADPDGEPYPLFEGVNRVRNSIDPRPLIQAVCCDLTEHVGISVIAGRFHASVAAALTTLAHRAAVAHGIDTVVLSGGCFMNRLLSDLVFAALGNKGLQVFKHDRVPCGDAGLGLGQAVIAAAAAQET